jgi:hypothetical protein
VPSYNSLMADAAGLSIDARLADWEARLERLEEAPAREAAQESNCGHLLFVPSAGGYELVEGAGESPSPGDLLEIDGRDGRYAVTRVVRSPLPNDGRSCAYLEAI